jgi:DNA-binding HxlR family transcriptional regulator
MASDETLDAPVCGLFHRASELIGRRWTGAIIYVLLRGRARFAALRAAIPGITDRMLSERLQELEQEGIVAREVIPETPVRIEYSLTDKGRALATPIEAIGTWAHDWLGRTANQPGGGRSEGAPAHADEVSAGGSGSSPRPRPRSAPRARGRTRAGSRSRSGRGR